VRAPRFEPGSSAWQADVLDQTRLRALRTVLRYSYVGKIVSLHLNLENLEKTVWTLLNQGSMMKGSIPVSSKDALSKRVRGSEAKYGF
jgi:hypothetical protein